jgi:hypothetical protein
MRRFSLFLSDLCLNKYFPKGQYTDLLLLQTLINIVNRYKFIDNILNNVCLSLI